jgi:uncharacterized RDD family membrane protein YckC
MTDNYYQPPKAELADLPIQFEHAGYVGFRVRAVASLIDAFLVVLVTFPLLGAIYGWTFFEGRYDGYVHGPAYVLIWWLAPAIAVVSCWVWKQATPGKMLFGARVVDAQTGRALSVGRATLRYLGYFLSTLLFCLPLLWVAFDRRKQGLHDKIAGSVVVRSRRPGRGAT